jgi:CheY-like chemotaxis protein
MRHVECSSVDGWGYRARTTISDRPNPWGGGADGIPFDHGVLSPIVIKVSGADFERAAAGLGEDPHGISVVVSEDDSRRLDLVLWHVPEMDASCVRAAIRAHRPTPVFVVLGASKRPDHVAQCLSMGAVQCLVDPAEGELVAHVHAVVRRLRRSQDIGPGADGRA